MTRMATRIDAFVEAVRALRALERAQQDDGRDRTAAILKARAAVRRAEALLTGGALAEARRRLARPPEGE